MTVAVLAQTANLFANETAMQGKAARRAGAEIAVLEGDIKRLQNEPKLTKIWRIGLVDRINGGLTGLPILTRLANEENGKPASGARDWSTFAQKPFSKAALARFSIAMTELAGFYPLKILPAVKDRKMARLLHQKYCSACHDTPYGDVERPAFNLFKQAQMQTGTEFLARLIVGVRGDRTTGLGNPLTDRELAALTEYYKNGKP